MKSVLFTSDKTCRAGSLSHTRRLAAWCFQAGLQQHRLICSDGSAANASRLKVDREACIEQLGVIYNGVCVCVPFFGASSDSVCKRKVHSSGVAVRAGCELGLAYQTTTS